MTTIDRLTKHRLTATPSPVTMPRLLCAHEGCDRAGAFYTNAGREAGRFCQQHWLEIVNAKQELETIGELV